MVKVFYYIENNGYKKLFSEKFIKNISKSFKKQAKEQIKLFIKTMPKPYQDKENI